MVEIDDFKGKVEGGQRKVVYWLVQNESGSVFYPCPVATDFNYLV